MGKKRDAWQNARDASRLAEGRVSDCNGGSTLDAMLQAQLDRQNAAIEEHFTYNEWQEDPEG